MACEVETCQVHSQEASEATEEEYVIVCEAAATEEDKENIIACGREDSIACGREDSIACVVFDWDDTLFATTHVVFQNQQDSCCRKLDSLVTEILAEALQLSQVYIITNATANWVESCAQQFLPNVVPLLKQVVILSARHLYEPHYPNEPGAWKRDAFKHIPQHKHIISIGDSDYERHAVIDLCATLPHTFCKSVKFQVCPSLDQLVAELECISHNIPYIIAHEGHLDLSITVHQLRKDLIL